MSTSPSRGGDGAADTKRHRTEQQQVGGGGGAKPAASRWSSGKYCNPNVPSYVPPEFVIFDNGTPLDLFLLRAQLDDARRMASDRADCEPFFMRRHGPVPIEPKFDAHGVRVNTPKQILAERKDRLARTISDRAKEFNRLGARGERQIIKKIYFTPAQIESKAYGAILGSRGVTHQKIEQETGCRIVLAGRGITLMAKDINLRNFDRSAEMAQERPHCRITAPSEGALQKAVEKVEWILSDVPDAIRFRDEMRKRLAIDNGTYDPKTWTPTPIPGEAPAAAAGAADAGDVDADAEANELLA